MYIFQPDRHLLKKQIVASREFITGKVLDVGAGEFTRYRYLFNVSEYIRMDVVKSESADVVGSAEDIPFAENTFDAVVCTQVFEHLQNPDKAAGEIRRVLKPGGYCLLTAPQTNELHEEPNDFYRYTNFGLTALFSRHGFRIADLKQRGGFFTLLSQMNIRYLIDKFNLYQKPFWGRVFSKVFRVYSALAHFLDQIDKSKANRKHTIGWLCVLQKKIT